MDKKCYQVLFLDFDSTNYLKDVDRDSLVTEAVFEVTMVYQVDDVVALLQGTNPSFDVLLVHLHSNQSSATSVLNNLLDIVQSSLSFVQLVVILVKLDVLQISRNSDVVQRIHGSGGVVYFAEQLRSHELVTYLTIAGVRSRQRRILAEYIDSVYRIDTPELIASHTLKYLNELFEWNRAVVTLIWGERPLLMEQSASFFQSLLAYSGYSRAELQPSLQRPIGDDPLLQEIIDRKEVYVWHDADQPVAVKTMLYEPTDILSWITLPLISNGNVVGLIMLGHRKAGHFITVEQQLLKDIATVAATAIVTKLRDRNIKTVQDIMQKISTKYVLEDLLQIILTVLRSVLKSTRCTYFQRREYIRNNNNEVFAELLVDERGVQLPDARFELPEGKGIAGWVLQNGRSRNIRNTSQEKDFLKRDEEWNNPLSLLAVPVKIGTRTIGIISVDHNTEGFFTSYDEELVEIIADQVASVIERTRTLNLLSKISTELNKQNKVADVLRYILEQALSLTNATSGVIYRLNEQMQEHLSIVASYSTPKEFEHPRPRLEEDGLTRSIIQQKSIVQFAPDFANVDRINPQLRDHGIQAVIGAPLFVDDKLIGILNLNSPSKQRFNEVEEFSLKLFADQAALAIDKAEKFDSLDSKTVALQKLYDATQAVGRNDHLKETFHAIAKQAYTLVGAKYSHVARVITQEDGRQVIQFEAAYPDEHRAGLDEKVGLIDLVSGSSLWNGRLGITGLAVRLKSAVLIRDIFEEVVQGRNSEVASYYIEYQKDTCSELAVPIFNQSKDVIGVINIEHSERNALTIEHQDIIASFAAQAALAIQKDELLSLTRQREQQLQQLAVVTQTIVSAPPDNIENTFRQVAEHVNKALGAKEVVVLRMSQPEFDVSQTSKRNPLDIDAHFSSRIETTFDIWEKSDPISTQVYYSRRPYPVENIQNSAMDLKKSIDPSVKSGLCLPLDLHKGCLGVMWLFFERPKINDYTSQDMALFQLYADQIALTYDLIEQSHTDKEELRRLGKDITVDINEYYRDTRSLAQRYNWLGLITSAGGILLITTGLIFQNNAQNIWNPGFLIGSGVSILMAVISALAFRRADVSNRRMDTNRSELLEIRRLSILLEHVWHIGDEQSKKILQEKIMELAAKRWFNSDTISTERESYKAK